MSWCTEPPTLNRRSTDARQLELALAEFLPLLHQAAAKARLVEDWHVPDGTDEGGFGRTGASGRFGRRFRVVSLDASLSIKKPRR